jgi:hypothetical protein
MKKWRIFFGSLKFGQLTNRNAVLIVHHLFSVVGQFHNCLNGCKIIVCQCILTHILVQLEDGQENKKTKNMFLFLSFVD